MPLITKITAGSAMSINLSLPLPPPPGVSLSLSALGVTSGVSFNLNVSVSASTPAGSYPIVIDGLSGAVDHQAPIMLTYQPPRSQYRLALQLQRSAAAAPFATSVLSVANLPPGLNASFSPASITSGQSSTLTFTADSTLASNQVVKVIVSGTAASETESAVVTLETLAGGGGGAGGTGPAGPPGPVGPAGPPGPMGPQERPVQQARRVHKVQITDGTSAGTRDLSLSSAANDSGVLSLYYKAGTPLKIGVLPPVGCKVSPASVNIVVQYQGR